MFDSEGKGLINPQGNFLFNNRVDWCFELSWISGKIKCSVPTVGGPCCGWIGWGLIWEVPDYADDKGDRAWLSVRHEAVIFVIWRLKMRICNDKKFAKINKIIGDWS